MLRFKMTLNHKVIFSSYVQRRIPKASSCTSSCFLIFNHVLSTAQVYIGLQLKNGCEYVTGLYVEGNGLGLFKGIVPDSVWMDCNTGYFGVAAELGTKSCEDVQKHSAVNFTDMSYEFFPQVYRFDFQGFTSDFTDVYSVKFTDISWIFIPLSDVISLILLPVLRIYHGLFSQIQIHTHREFYYVVRLVIV